MPSLAAHRKRTRNESAVPGPAGQLVPTATSPPPAPDPALRTSSKRTKIFWKSSCWISFSVLCTIFTGPGVPPTSYCPSSLPGHTRGDTGGGIEIYTGFFLLLPGLVAECHFGKWISVGDLLAHLGRGIDLTRSDEDYGGHQPAPLPQSTQQYPEQPQSSGGSSIRYLFICCYCHGARPQNPPPSKMNTYTSTTHICPDPTTRRRNQKGRALPHTTARTLAPPN